jgi:hypothetical protein
MLPLQSLVDKVRPTKDHVLVELEPDAEYKGIIELPKNRKPQGKRAARVVACGPDALKEVSPGARVLCANADPGWELGAGFRMLRVGALEGVLEEGVTVEP